MENDFRSDSMHFSKELTLLLSIMRMDKGESMLWKDQDQANEIDWGAFLQLARHHRVFSLLYTNLRQTDSAWIPTYVMNALQKDYQENTFNMLRLSAEMEQICKLFSESDIRTIVLKGPVLADDLYGNISLRTSRDLDILIPIQHVDQAHELLRSQGYVKEEEYNTILDDWKWRHHHATFIHPDKRVTLEIHWRLGPGPGKEPGFDELWERKRISKITSHPVYYLGREDLFLFLASHGARHGWSRLRWLIDMDRITRQNIDYAKLHTLLTKNRQLHLGAQAMILAAQLLHTPLTAEMESMTTGKRAKRLAADALFYIRQMVNLHTAPVPEHVSKYHKKHLFSLMSAQQKILFVLSFFYPYPEDADTLTLPKRLHFLYFPLRPVLWAWRKTNSISQRGT
ncbi:nucleotidyltransferase family protein [Paenibacillus alginolyticus]|uniref:nucleotidyltransferase domain-containing protein n=1 Tax=Paenibacillus alginolyticus TaxID=59839 RepID=UPI0003FE34DA|nr:nucleotidyltransferase family protein [Paenibacillus alginolyticus]MCY9664544.1 nucleotidyltransferase family protein [Paenibacillus alginolyticus]